MGPQPKEAPFSWARGDAAVVVPVLLACAAAWLLLWEMGHPHVGSGSHHHHGSTGAVLADPSALASAGFLFVSAWVVMTVAMMLPTSLPLLAIFRRLTRARRDRTGLLLLVIGGYLAVWALFGVAAFAGARVLEAVSGAGAFGGAGGRFAPAALFLLAGAFQLSSLKYRCLDLCRSPLGFVTSHWHGVRERREAFRLGADHGLFCVGCCWALMLLMFAASAAHLLWMLLLGALMAFEKNVSWGRRIAVPAGIALAGVGIVLAVAAAQTW